LVAEMLPVWVLSSLRLSACVLPSFVFDCISPSVCLPPAAHRAHKSDTPMSICPFVHRIPLLSVIPLPLLLLPSSQPPYSLFFRKQTHRAALISLHHPCTASPVRVRCALFLFCFFRHFPRFPSEKAPSCTNKHPLHTTHTDTHLSHSLYLAPSFLSFCLLFPPISSPDLSLSDSAWRLPHEPSLTCIRSLPLPPPF